MPRPRPEFSITLPKDFTFHYSEGEAPQTPDQTTPAASLPDCSRPLRPYRLKRPYRPPVASIFKADDAPAASIHDQTPVSSIETTAHSASRPVLFTNRASTLSKLPSSWKSPRTPEPRRRPSLSRWDKLSEVGESIVRPLSSCSLFSDSSEASDLSLTSEPPGGGSCTSVESDALPVNLPLFRKASSYSRSSSPMNAQATVSALQPSSRWTPDMDRHIWATYLHYLQDPTVTPFKMLPGVAPPLGICHRVAREARKAWRGGFADTPDPEGRMTMHNRQQQDDDVFPARHGSPDTIREQRSGSITPKKGLPSRKYSPWPKSGSATRRRLRQLCKRKPYMAPHYQRIFQNRSPSPFTRSSRSSSQSCPGLPANPSGTTSFFNSRDVQISLTTCTADTMQPDGPLARLAEGDGASHDTPSQDFNEPPVPFASDIPVPSELNRDTDAFNQVEGFHHPMTPRLGSPFGHHTWGPSQYRKQRRTKTGRSPLNGLATIGFSSGPQMRFYRDPLDPLTNTEPGSEQQLDGISLDRKINSSTMHADDRWLSQTQCQYPRIQTNHIRGQDTKQHPLESLFDAPDSSKAAILSTPFQSRNALECYEPSTPTPVSAQLSSPFHAGSQVAEENGLPFTSPILDST